MMEYKKTIKFLDNTPNKPTKFRTKNWIEINDDTCGMYNKMKLNLNLNTKVKFM